MKTFRPLSSSENFESLISSLPNQITSNGLFQSSIALTESAVVALLGLFIPLFAYLIIDKFFGDRIAKWASRRFSGRIWGVAKGENTGFKLNMSRVPVLNEAMYTEIGKSDAILQRALDETKKRASASLTKDRSMFFYHLMKSGGSIFEVLRHTPNKPDFSQSLIHCNYFTEEMASYLSDYTKEIF